VHRTPLYLSHPSRRRFQAVLAGLGLAVLAACSSQPAAQGPATPAKTTATTSASTRILAFSVSNENLVVDKVGLRDGLMRADGNRDLAFTATVEGPFTALFVVSTNAKGEPGYGLRADTLTGTDEIPTELGGVVDTGKMTVGIGVVEGGKFINGESGSARGGDGLHNLTLYIPNTATLQAGSHVRIYVRDASGILLAGPIAPY
jgi:hypothetical protein